MDILGEYEKQNPQPVQAAIQRQSTPEYGFFIRLIMRLSGGKIQNTRQASYALLAVAGVVMIAAVTIFLSGSFGGNKIENHPLPTPVLPPGSTIR